MEAMIRPAETEAIPESLHEHFELAHYIDVFRSSAERVRRVIFIIMVFSVVMVVAQWNTASYSWLSMRYDFLKSVYSKVKDEDRKKADAAVYEGTKHRIGSLEELKNYIAY